MNFGGEMKSLTGIGILVKYSTTTSTLYFNCAETGIIGEFWALVPCVNLLIWSNCVGAVLSFITISILFCTIIIFFKFIFSTAARCSDVWGCGQGSFAANY